MTSESQTTTADDIADAIRRNLCGRSTAAFPLPVPYSRVSEVQLWIDRWEKASAADRPLLEDAAELAAVKALGSDDREVIAGALRLLRRVRRRTIGLRPLKTQTREALVIAANTGRLKKVDSAYGELHAELLACIGNLRVKADDFPFWATQMTAPEYVASAVSGCLDSGSPELARQGVMLAIRKQDPTLPFSLDRLLRLHHPNEDEVWIWFLSAYRTGHLTDDDWRRMAEAAAVFDRIAPDRNAPIVAIPQRAPASSRPAVSAPSRLESRVFLRRRLSIEKLAGEDVLGPLSKGMQQHRIGEYVEEYEFRGNYDIKEMLGALADAPPTRNIEDVLRQILSRSQVPGLQVREQAKPESLVSVQPKRSADADAFFP